MEGNWKTLRGNVQLEIGEIGFGGLEERGELSENDRKGCQFMGQDQGRIFSSWKEIAGFLGKGVRTVQRWEKTHGLPVSRPIGCATNVVFAKEEELMRWMRNQDSGNDWSGSRSVSSQLREFQTSLARLEETHSRLEQSVLEAERRLDEIELVIRIDESSKVADLSEMKSEGDQEGLMSAD